MTLTINSDLSLAMHNYNKTHTSNFNLIDAFIVSALTLAPYTTDTDLAVKALCSERTIKRSINKLCEEGIIQKHLDHDNTKHVHIITEAYNNLLTQYCYKYNNAAGDLK